MSGQPVNSQADANKKRAEYMETLALQSQINDMNLQANKNYLLSGILPAVSQMKETRTTSEILLDIEYLKRNIVEDLKGLYDPSITMSIINEIMKSPLNIDNSLFVFLAQNLPSIARKMKEKFRYGVVGDANDIATLVDIIESFYAKNKESLTSAKAFFDSSSIDGAKSIMNKSDFDTIKKQLQTIINNIAGNKMLITNNLETALMREIDFISTNLPDNELIRESAEIARTNIDVNNDTQLETLNLIIRKIPPINIFTTLVKRLESSVDTRNTNIANQVITNMYNIINPLYNELRNLTQFGFFQTARQNLNNRRNMERQQDIQRMREDQSIKNSAQNAQAVKIVNQP
jgi:hypothetical protein